MASSNDICSNFDSKMSSDEEKITNPKYVGILDFEASCDDLIKFYDNEVIEFPTVLLKLNDTGTYDIVSEFQKYCKPLIKSKITKFCTDLTGITQEQVDNGTDFPEALEEHCKWITSHVNHDEKIVFMTVGNWDLGTMMPQECKKWNLVPPTIYHSFVNINVVFSDFYKIRSGGMKRMLEYLGIELTGKHHSGIDDCRNTAKIWQRLVSDGCVLKNEFIVQTPISDYKIMHPNSKKEKIKEEMRKKRLSKK